MTLNCSPSMMCRWRWPTPAGRHRGHAVYHASLAGNDTPSGDGGNLAGSPPPSALHSPPARATAGDGARGPRGLAADSLGVPGHATPGWRKTASGAAMAPATAPAPQRHASGDGGNVWAGPPGRPTAPWR
ncbi:MAG: hypothetical protein IPI20_09960 [Rhodoferax sp.]|nr:hypothetical protein [Rhodoferax sp.]